MLVHIHIFLNYKVNYKFLILITKIENFIKADQFQEILIPLIMTY